MCNYGKKKLVSIKLLMKIAQGSRNYLITCSLAAEWFSCIGMRSKVQCKMKIIIRIKHIARDTVTPLKLNYYLQPMFPPPNICSSGWNFWCMIRSIYSMQT